MRTSLVLAFILVTGFIPYTASASTDIQMLPPLGCPSGGPSSGVIAWNGTDPLGCVPNFYADQGGNVSVGPEFLIQGATLGPLTPSSSDTVNNLRNLDACPAGTLLTKTGSNTFACTSSGVPSCGAGQTLAYNSSGQPVCQNPPVVGANPLYIATYQYTTSNGWNGELRNGITAVWGAPPGAGNVNSDASWNTCNVPDETDGQRISTVAHNTDCIIYTCEGHFNKYPQIAQSNGECAAGSTNPQCNGGDGLPPHMIIQINCQYTQ